MGNLWPIMKFEQNQCTLHWTTGSSHAVVMKAYSSVRKWHRGYIFKVLNIRNWKKKRIMETPEMRCSVFLLIILNSVLDIFLCCGHHNPLAHCLHYSMKYLSNRTVWNPGNVKNNNTKITHTFRQPVSYNVCHDYIFCMTLMLKYWNSHKGNFFISGKLLLV